MTNENLSAFQIAEAKELARHEHFAFLLANTKKLVEAFCTPERLVDQALKGLAAIGPFNYEILEVRYMDAPISTVSADGKKLRFEPSVIPASVIVRDRLDKNIVFALTLNQGTVGSMARDIGRGAASPQSKQVKDLLSDTEAYREAFWMNDPFLQLSGYDFELDVVEWKAEVQAAPEVKSRFGQTKKNIHSRIRWDHWHPVNSTPIRTFGELKRAVENCPSNPAQGFFNQNAVVV